MKKKTIIKVFFSVLTVFFAFLCCLSTLKSKSFKAETITDLTNTTWLFNNTINSDCYAYLNFTSNSTTYTYIQCYTDPDDDWRYMYYNYDQVYYHINWFNNEYKTISINGGSDVTNQTVINWFISNATLQTPPTPSGTQITKKYWAPYGVITMSDDETIGDNEIQYTVLFNEFTDMYDETTQTGLIFKGVQTEQDPAWSYIESINGSGINILYHGTTNNIDNSMWLEFTYGDYMDTNLYNLMELYGYWFDDEEAYLVGMNQGYVEGKQEGRALGQADGVEFTNLIRNILNGIGDLLSIQVFPNITIGLIIGLPLLLGVFVIIIKILRG